VDAAVLEQPFEREAGDLATDAVEAGQQHRAGRVVDDEVDPGQRLEGADVAALAADDAALQLVRLERDDRNGRLDGVTRGHALHDGGEDAARATVGVVARLLLDLTDQPRALVAQVILQLAHHDLLRLAGAQACHALELAQLIALRRLQFLADVLEVALAVVERALALVQPLAMQLERALLGAQALLQAGELRAAGPQLVLDLFTGCASRPGLAAGRTLAAFGRGERPGGGMRGARSLQ
jgi:hypothetical protein